MQNKTIMHILLGSTFVLALIVSAFWLKPEPPEPLKPIADTLVEVEAEVEAEVPEAKPEPVPEPKPLVTGKADEEIVSALSQSLQDVKAGKKSILTVIFSDEDLNQQLKDLLALSENGEAWADYAIGQLAEMCTYLYETPETTLIEMFSGVRAAARPEQQAQMSELLPVVVNASKRCKTLDAEQLNSLGDSGDWFDRAAEARDPNAFVVSGYGLITDRMFAESKEYAAAKGAERSEIRNSINESAKQEFRTRMRDFIVNGKTNPETVMSMAEHLNLFYEEGHPFKNKEAWMLLACEQGYESNCSSSSTAMSVFCMFDSLCTTGGDFQQGVLWAQGQYRLDEHQRVADELRAIFDSKDWGKLGF